MTKAEDKMPSDFFQRVQWATEIGNRDVRRAIREAHEAGLATVHAQTDGTLYWKLPNGEITLEDPYRPGGPLAHRDTRKKP